MIINYSIGGVLIVHLAGDTLLLPVDSAVGLDKWPGGIAAVTPGNLQGVGHDSLPRLAMKDTARSDWHLWRVWNWLGWQMDWQGQGVRCWSPLSDQE